MTDRLSASEITDDQLDALYAETGRLAAELEQLRAADQRVRGLHRQEFGTCRECTGESGVQWPCATIRALDAPAPPASTDHERTDQ